MGSSVNFTYDALIAEDLERVKVKVSQHEFLQHKLHSLDNLHRQKTWVRPEFAVSQPQHPQDSFPLLGPLPPQTSSIAPFMHPSLPCRIATNSITSLCFTFFTRPLSMAGCEGALFSTSWFKRVSTHNNWRHLGDEGDDNAGDC